MPAIRSTWLPSRWYSQTRPRASLSRIRSSSSSPAPSMIAPASDCSTAMSYHHSKRHSTANYKVTRHGHTVNASACERWVTHYTVPTALFARLRRRRGVALPFEVRFLDWLCDATTLSKIHIARGQAPWLFIRARATYVEDRMPSRNPAHEEQALDRHDARSPHVEPQRQAERPQHQCLRVHREVRHDA